MCVDMHVTLPMVGSFLLLYSLRFGSFVILIWTALRSFFCLFFFVIVILEALVKRDSPLGELFVHTLEATTEDNIFFVYYCSIFMVIAEAFLFVYCYYLAVGLHCHRSQPISQYLICRFINWMIEVTSLFALILVHKLLVGWYLGFLLFVILEFYGFIVTYSYFIELCEEECREFKSCDY